MTSTATYKLTKSIYEHLKGGRLSDEGKIIVQKWMSSDSDYRTAFLSKHYTTVRDTIEMFVSQRVPKNTELNIIFISTGSMPYPEIALLNDLVNNGYKLGKIYLLDTLYGGRFIDIQELQMIISSALKPNITIENISLLGSPITVQERIQGIPIHLFCGFNYQLSFTFTDHEDRNRKRAQMLDFLTTLLSDNPEIVSIGVVSGNEEPVITIGLINNFINYLTQ